MRSLLLISGLLALVLSPAFSQSVSTIDPALIVSTLNVKTKHLRVEGSSAPDIWYEVNNCTISPSAARKDFQNNLGQRFLGSNPIRRRRRVYMTKCG
jgi:hypothetical protein